MVSGVPVIIENDEASCGAIHRENVNERRFYLS